MAAEAPSHARATPAAAVRGMDIHCGAILDGELDVAQMGQRIFDAILRHASGEPTTSETLGLGDHEFVPRQLGMVS